MAREVPSIPTGLDAQTRNFFSAIREAVNEFTVAGGNTSAGTGAGTGLNAITATNLTGISSSLDKLLSTTIPPQAVNFKVQKMRVNSFITWDNPNYTYYNFAEIWRKPASLAANLMVAGTIYTITEVGTVNWTALGATIVVTTSMVTGKEYVITDVGDVNWSTIGLIGSPIIGAVFTKNAATATGTGSIISASFTKNSTTATGIGAVKYEPDFTGAVLVGTSNGHIFVDSIDPGTDYAYWIRFLSNANIAGPYNSNSGTLGIIGGDTHENLYGINAWLSSADILDGQITNAKIGNTIQSDNYNGTTLGWQLSKNGGNLNLNQLTIRDAAGNVILSSGAGVNWGNVLTTTAAPTRNVYKGNWTLNTNYIVGDIVLDTLGYGWSCIQAHTSSTTTTTGILVPIYIIGGANSNAYWSLYAVKGVDAVSVILSNNAHTLPAASDGAVSSYLGSGTTVRVFDGTREVLYDVALATAGVANGVFNVVATPDNIMVGTLTDSGNYLTVGVHRGVTNGIDTASIIYAVTGKTFNGTAFSINTQQSFSKSKAGLVGTTARAVDATSDNQVFNYTSAGITPSPTTSVITATARNATGILTLTYAFKKGLTVLQAESPVATYTYTPPASYSTLADQITVELYEGGVLTATDTLTMAGLKPGVNGIGGILTNETHVTTTASDGTGYALTSAGGTFKVYSGVTDVTTSSTFTVTTATFNGLTLAIVPATGIYTLSGTSWTSDSESFTVNATYGGATLSKVYKISKAKAGIAAISSSLSNSDQTIPTDSQGSNGIFTGCATTMSVYIGSTDDSANWTYAVTKSTGVTCTEAVSSRVQTVTAMTTDTGTITIVASKTGFASQTEVFTLAKAKSGVAYQIVLSNSAIKKTVAGVLAPTTLVLTANRLDSNGISAYSGRFKIYLNGSATATYISATDLATYTYPVGATDTTIKCELYLAGGVTVLLDTQTIPVVADGATGSDASNFSIKNAGATFTKGIDNVILPANLALTTSYSNITSPTYQWSKSTDGTTFIPITGETSASYTILATDYAAVTVNSYKCEVTGTINGASGTLNDVITIPLLTASKSVSTVVLSNENITFPADSTAAVTSFTGGDCNVTAYIGSTQLTPTTIPAITTYLPVASTVLTTGAYAVTYDAVKLTCAKPLKTISAVDITTDILTSTAHGFSALNGVRHSYSGTGAAIGGLVNNTSHYAVTLDANTFYLTTSTSTAAAVAFVALKRYYLATLGTTTQAQWNTLAGTTALTYAVGSIFTCAIAGVGTGTAYQILDLTTGLATGNVYYLCDSNWNASLYSTTSFKSITAVNTTTHILTSVAHGFTALNSVKYSYTGTTLGGLANNTANYAVTIDANTFYLTSGTATIAAGTFIVGKMYCLAALGTTTQAQWNTITGNTTLTHPAAYALNEIFTCANAGVAMGTGTAYQILDLVGGLVTGSVYYLCDSASLLAATPFNSGAKLTFNADLNVNAMLGLTTDPAASNSYNTIDYAIYCNGATAAIYMNGVNKLNTGTYTSTDTFAILYNNDTVSFYKNGICLYTTDVAKDLILYVDSSFQYVTTTASYSFSNIGFSAYVGPAANTFTYDSTSTATIGAETVSGLIVNIPAPTVMSTNTAYTDVSITPIDAATNPLPTITKRINYSKSIAGTAGANGSTLSIQCNNATVFSATDTYIDIKNTTLTPSVNPDLVFTANTNLISPTYQWTVTGLLGTGIPTGAALQAATLTITALQFGAARSALVSCTANGNTTYSDSTPITRLDHNTATFQDRLASQAYSSSFTLASTTGTTKSVTTLTKVAAAGIVTGAWDTHGYSTNSYVTTATTTFQFGLVTGATSQVGLSASTTSVDQAGLDYSIRITATGGIKIVELGVASSNIYFASTAITDVFEVTYVGTTIYYIKNGFIFSTSTTTAGRTFFFNACLYYLGSIVNNITFGQRVNTQLVGATAQGSITKSNISTWISDLAVDTLQIADHAISYTTFVPSSTLTFTPHGSSTSQTSILIIGKASIFSNSINAALVLGVSGYVNTDYSLLSTSGSNIGANVVVTTFLTCSDANPITITLTPAGGQFQAANSFSIYILEVAK